MQKLLIHSQGTVEHGEQIRTFLEMRLPYEVSISKEQKTTFDLLAQRSIQLLIFETNRFSELDLNMFREIRNLGYTYPILLLAENLDMNNFMPFIEKLKGWYLEKPFEYKALRGVVQKLMSARTVPQQMHRRFRTKQNAVVETYISGEVINSLMFNLSVGGAYFEFNSKSKVSVGDLVRLKVQLDDVSKEHCVNARVVWTTRKGTNGAGNGFGVRFVKGHDIYRQLIDKV